VTGIRSSNGVIGKSRDNRTARHRTRRSRGESGCATKVRTRIPYILCPFAQNVGSTHCLQAVGRECGLIGSECGLTRSHICAECELNTALVCKPACDCLQAATSIRQHVAAVGRRVTTLCKGEEGLQQQLALYQTYYNFCLPHASLRLALPQPEPTKGTGSASQWRPGTPAMAAGLTDRVWSLREVLLFRVPPWPQPQAL
jgi:hypothetical protein